MAHGLEHALGVGPITHEDAGLQEPWGLQRAEPRRHGMQVLRARPRPAWVQLDADGRALKDRRKGRELNAAAAGHVEHGANGQAVRIQQRRTLGRDLPRRGQGFAASPCTKERPSGAVGSRTTDRDGSESSSAGTRTSCGMGSPCDVRAHEQALEGDARSSKGLSAAFLTVENGNDAHDVAVGFSTQTRHGLDR